MNLVAHQQFEAELAQVEQRINEEIADLFPPFSQMVAAQLQRSQPLMRAAVVLATGVAAEDNDALREQRINLAAALEMLHLAINVHILLSETVGEDAPNLSLLGSTILAGDYCFSRSASLAVRTGDQKVVEIFSDTLKRVSEGHLRWVFDSAGEPYNEDRELLLAGAEAAAQLARWPAKAYSQARRFVESLADCPAGAPSQADRSDEPSRSLSVTQRERWLAFLDWCTAQSLNLS